MTFIYNLQQTQRYNIITKNSTYNYNNKENKHFLLLNTFLSDSFEPPFSRYRTKKTQSRFSFNKITVDVTIIFAGF